jgi:hypothetical protein
MPVRLVDVWGEAMVLMADSREVIVPSRAGAKVLGKRGHKWYLRPVRWRDTISLPATEGVGASNLDPA